MLCPDAQHGVAVKVMNDADWGGKKPLGKRFRTVLVSCDQQFYFGRWAGWIILQIFTDITGKLLHIVSYMVTYYNYVGACSFSASDETRDWNQGQGWIRARDGQKSFASSGSVVMISHLWLKGVPWSKHGVFPQGDGHLQFIPIHRFRLPIINGWAYYVFWPRHIRLSSC